MQITDTATPSPSDLEAQAAESTQALLAQTDDRTSPPLPSHSSDLAYAVRLLAITSTVGMSTVLLGQCLWQPDTKAARLPASEAIGVTRNAQPLLRDRVSVTALRSSALSPPESLGSLPINATRPSQPATDLPTVRINHGFSDGSRQSPLAATLPVLTLPPPPTVPTLVAQASPPACNQTASQPAKTLAADQPPAVIASLLQAPQPQSSDPVTSTAQAADPVTIESRTNLSGAPAASSRNPSQAALMPVAKTVKPAISPTLPVPSTAIAMPIGSAIQLSAMKQPSAPSESGYIEPLTITGNTRFSSRQLVDLVQNAIATQARQLAINHDSMENRSNSQMALQTASEAITQFYAAHGYTNVQVSVSTTTPSGATPQIRIVEGVLEARDRVSPHD